MMGKNAACQRRNWGEKGEKKHPIMVTMHSFLFFYNSAHEITNSLTKHVVCFQSKQLFLTFSCVIPVRDH